MITFIKNTLVILFVGLLIFFAANFYGPLKEKAYEALNMGPEGVKGASTERAEELKVKFSQDINSQVENGKKQILNLRISDMLGIISRIGKIPQDIKGVENYLLDQGGEYLKQKFNK